MESNKKIYQDLKRLALQMFANREAVVYLYGSQARGDAHPDSDWDILIVTNDDVSTSDAFANYAFPFAEIGWTYGVDINPLLYTRSQWEAERNTAFYHSVQADCIPL